jgi:3-oxoacyl-[acyl-carrier protein] reductase
MNILITGGISGLGGAITINLASDKSAHLIATYCNSVQEARALTGEYNNVKAVKCDFSKEDELEELLVIIREEQIDVLINNALSFQTQGYFHKINPASFQESFLKNILPTIKITKEAIQEFRKRKFGKIITILSSFLVNRPPIGLSLYVAEKNYLYSMAKSWAIENSRFNITSNMISPSFMQTNLNKNADGRTVQNNQADLPLRKFLTTEEVAESVKFLVYGSQQMNGNNIIINQGTDLL